MTGVWPEVSPMSRPGLSVVTAPTPVPVITQPPSMFVRLEVCLRCPQVYLKNKEGQGLTQSVQVKCTLT